MSPETRVQVVAVRMIANFATHIEGRPKITPLVVSTLERLLDSSNNQVC